jgi:phosphoribosylformimino-5-aminoimidazole carboxamide ribotide isomerase
MLILPAIDLRGGNCVRLVQGRAEDETVYSTDPVEIALQWKNQGARILHVADLDGAFTGRPVNLQLAAKMMEATGLPVQIGGGYRDLPSIEQAIHLGMTRVILGTAAVNDKTLLVEAVRRFGKAIAVSIDAAGDYAAVSGWTHVSSIRFEELAAQMVQLGVQQLLFTDTRKDGTLTGPNLAAIRLFLAHAKAPLIVSGGMSKVEDVAVLRPLEKEGLSGVVIGKALYDGKIDLAEAIRAAGPQA